MFIMIGEIIINLNRVNSIGITKKNEIWFHFNDKTYRKITKQELGKEKYDKLVIKLCALNSFII